MSQISFEIVAECPDTRARAGLLHTPHGTIETPVFMPVGTQATVKGLTQRDLAEDLGVQILLANTYHLYLRPGHESIRKMGGLHQFMSWPNAILTDSGGFQVFSLSGLRKIDEAGVVFQSHLNGDPHTFTPESTVDVQLAYRQRHPDGARRVPRVSRQPRVRAREHAAHGAVGAARRTDHFLQPHGGECPRATRCSRSCKARCSRTCAANARPRWSNWMPTAMRSAASRWASRARSASKMVEATEDDPAAPQAALRHGCRHAGRTAGIRGPRHRHDGLRPAVAQRAQRLPVHLRRARHHQARAL